MRVIIAWVVQMTSAADNKYSSYGQWEPWGEWSECTVSSDYGTRVRYRKCSNIDDCSGRAYEVNECDEDPIFCNDVSSTTDSHSITCTDSNNKTTELDVGSQCVLECNDEFTQVGGESTIFCDYSGGWRGELGTCERIMDDEPGCIPLPDIDYGFIYCSNNWEETSECLVHCEDGYHISENQDTRCVNSTWTKEVGECEPEPTCNENEYYTCFIDDCQDSCHSDSESNSNCDKTIDIYHTDCIWGCACAEGFVLSDDGKCVSRDSCQCYMDTTELNYAPNSITLQNSCTEQCECTGQQWNCKDYTCSGGSQCLLDLQGNEYCEEVEECPTGYDWTRWTDVDGASNGNDRESAKKARKRYPGYGICSQPFITDGRSREEPDQHLPQLRDNGWLIRSANDRIVCNKRDQRDKRSCPDLEARYCCPAAIIAQCPTDTGEWTTWSNTDSNDADGGDYELLITHRERNPQICQHPSAIDYRHNSSQLVSDDVLTVDLEYGLICYNKDQSSNQCEDYEVRFCCDYEKDLSCLSYKRPFNGRPNPTWLPPDSCCGERPYNSHLKVCCKSYQLVDIDDGCDFSSR